MKDRTGITGSGREQPRGKHIEGRERPLSTAIFSRPFAPSIGGLEHMAWSCAEYLGSSGFSVTVITETGDEMRTVHPDFQILRQPNYWAKASAVRQSDAVLMFNVSLRDIWIPLLFRKPVVVSHQGACPPPLGLDWRNRLKHLVSRRATNICCSDRVASWLRAPSTVIPNTYDATTFRRREGARDRDLLFVARLVSDKGGALLLQALRILNDLDETPSLTIAGSGPESESLRSQAAGLTSLVEFVGSIRGTALGELMNRHRVLAVPSIWEEPFGIVALEGIASGCRVVGSSGGGLPTAVGECGEVFQSGDPAALARALQAQLEAPPLPADVAKVHLANFETGAVMSAYRRALYGVSAGRD